MSKNLELEESKIYQAERLRASGDLNGAVEITKRVLELGSGGIEKLLPEDRTLLLMAARIFVVSQLSRAGGSWKADGVASGLSEARKGIVDLYRKVDMSQMKKDAQGNPYEFSAETARDEAQYLMKLAALTGNISYLSQATTIMDGALRQATDPMSKTLLQFEINRVSFKQIGGHLAFRELKDSYTGAISASKGGENWERVATVASRYAVDSISHGRIADAISGISDFVGAVKENKALVKILPKEFVKAATETIRHKVWRLTGSKHDYTRLVLG